MNKKHLPDHARGQTISRPKREPLHRSRGQQTPPPLRLGTPDTRRHRQRHRRNQHAPPTERVRHRNPEDVARSDTQDVDGDELGDGFSREHGPKNGQGRGNGGGAEVGAAAVDGEDGEDGEFAPLWVVQRVVGGGGGLGGELDGVARGMFCFFSQGVVVRARRGG